MSRPTLTCTVAGVTASTPRTRNVAADVAEPTADVTESGPVVAPGGTVVITRFAAASVIVAGLPANDSIEFGASPLPKTDRKTTRLNSSHSQISYAVFCLK